MNRPECETWIAISDREAIGDAISDEERRFQKAHEVTCRVCADEAAIWGSLDGASVDSVLPEGALEKVLAAARQEQSAAARQESAAVASMTRPTVATARRRTAAVVAGALALAAGMFVLARRQSSPIAIGTADEIPPPAATPEFEMPTTVPPVLAPAAEARVAAGSSPTCRMIAPGATACLGAGSEVTTARLEPPRRVLDLVKGRVVVSLAPQAPGTSFGVATSVGTVTAVGTIFSVEMLANGDAIARVERGEVVVQATNGVAEQHLFAGEQMRIGDTRRVQSLTMHDRRRDLSLLTYREDRAASRGEKGGEVAEREERAAAKTDRTDRNVEPKSAAGESTAQPSAPTAQPLAAAPVATNNAAANNPAPINNQPIANNNAQSAQPPLRAATPAPVRDLLARARSLRSQGAFREAADAYRGAFASDPHGAEGRTALVSLGGLLLSELNDPAGALQAFDSYLGGSKGALAQEAEFGRIRALRALGRYEAEKAAILSFLANHPEGPDAQVLRRRLETMGTK